MSASCGSGSAAAPCSIRAQLKDEGLHIILPWDKLFLYDLRLQSLTETYNAISKDGVSLTATINIRFQLKHNSVPHASPGRSARTTSIAGGPEIGSQMREVIANTPPSRSIRRHARKSRTRSASARRAMLGDKMMEREGESDDLQRTRSRDTINLYRHAHPRHRVAGGHRHRHQSQDRAILHFGGIQFRVEREKKESERKQIEADGIREFQQTVSQGISDSYLRWRGIEATLQLAQSTNSKVVIIGSGKDGLPIILGNVDAPPPAPDRTPPSDAGPRPTAAPPTTSSEKVPAAGMAEPSENLPTASAPEVPRTYFPFPLTMSEIEAFFSRLSGAFTVGSGTVPAPK